MSLVILMFKRAMDAYFPTCMSYAYNVHGGQKEMLNLPEETSQMAESHLVLLGTKPECWFFAKAENALNHEVIFLAPKSFLFIVPMTLHNYSKILACFVMVSL